jgi:FkbM family methyltransferase
MKRIISLFYKYFPKQWVKWMGGSKMLEGIRDRLLRPGGKLEIHRERIVFDDKSFLFQAPLKIVVKASKKGIERDLVRGAKKLLREQGKEAFVIFDVGANYGFVSFAWHTGLEQSTDIVMFEPHPGLCSLLRETIDLNGFTGIRVEPLALGDSPGRISINLYEGTANVMDLQELKKGVTEVEQMTLDAYVQSSGKQPDLIKIDVDGYELNVLRGMQETVRRHKPIIAIETNDSPELMAYLLQLGYRCYDEALVPVPEGIVPKDNIFCIYPKG